MKISNVFNELSILVSNYNNAECFDQLFKSIDDAYQNSKKNIKFEVIITDDASSDNSLEKLKDIVKQYPEYQIRVVEHVRNSSLLKTRQTNLKYAQYNHINFFDADDYFTVDYFSKLEKYVGQFIDMIYYGAITSDNRSFIKVDANTETIKSSDLAIGNKVIKKSLLDDYKFYKMQRSEDHSVTINLISKANNVIAIPDTLVVYRVNVGSITRKGVKFEIDFNFSTKQVYKVITSLLQDYPNHANQAQVIDKVNELILNKYTYDGKKLRKMLNKKPYYNRLIIKNRKKGYRTHIKHKIFNNLSLSYYYMQEKLK